jgi:O-antigen ligase
VSKRPASRAAPAPAILREEREPREDRFGRGLLLAHLVLSPLVFSRDTVEAFEYPKVALLMLVAIALAALEAAHLLAIVAAAPRPLVALGNRIRAATGDPVTLGVMLFLASALVSTLTSMSPRTSLLGDHESFGGLGTVLSYGVVFFATRRLHRNASDAGWLLVAPVAASAAATAWALIQAAGRDPVAWTRLSAFGGSLRPFGTLGHSTILASYLAMAFPLAATFAALALQRGRRSPAAVFALAAILSAVLVVLSLSRAGWLALVAAGLVLLLADFSGRARGSVGVTAALAGASLGATILYLALPAGEPMLDAIFERLRQLTEASARVEIWRASASIFLANPIFGSGLDTFGLAFPPLRSVAYAYASAEWGLTPRRAHNEALHVLATQGLLGAAAALMLLRGFAIAALRALRRAATEEKRILGAMLAGTAAFLAASLFGFVTAASGTLFVTFLALVSRLADAEAPAPMRAPGARERLAPLSAAAALAATLFAHNVGVAVSGRDAALLAAGLVLLPVALVAAAAERLEAGHGAQAARTTGADAAPRPSLVQRAGVVTVALGLAWFAVLRPLAADRACSRGIRLLPSDPRAAIEAHERAVALDPSRELHWVKLGIAAEAGARKATHQAEWHRRLLLARTAFERAARLAPASGFDHLHLCRLVGTLAHERLASPAEAFAECDAAIRLDPNNPAFHRTAADIALVLVDLRRAASYAERSARLYPRLGSPHAQLGRVALAEGRLQEALRELKAAFEGEWRGDQNGRALAASALSAALLRLGRTAEAEQYARFAASRAPDSAEARRNLERALEARAREAGYVKGT